ncbi:hypothetical protein N0V82_001864 [Gnomoniopsis sp. IMI 355080]|nr:hypothetical protein N0V82_001864 [Gnomoniopsis sp. IMI 355080]
MKSFILLLTTLAAAVSATPATCVASAAASTSTSLSMADYTAVTAPVTGTGYDIDAAFQAAYGFNSTMSISMTHSSNSSDYASFKCQFACNGNSGCVSFFGRFVNVNTEEESFECLNFKTILDDTAFTTSTSNIANGGYNKMPLRPIRLLVNGQAEPLGINTPNPEFSWALNTEREARNVVWSHYAIEVSRSTSFQKSSLEWNTGKRSVAGSQVAISYEGRSLDSKTRYYWRACVWSQSRSQEGHESKGDGVTETGVWESVETSWFETGLLGSETVMQPGSLPWPQEALLKRIFYRIGVFSIVNFFFRPLLAFRHIKSIISPAPYAPTIVKTYACRKNLPIRIFLPQSRTLGVESPGTLPLLLTIHGGGFTFGHPTDNEEWNYKFSNRHSTLVIALDYAKAPSNPFPSAHSDLEALIRAILTDTELKPHIDTRKVGVIGWSAGGSLALGVSTLPSLREHIQAVVAMYPSTDFSAKTEQKVLTRQYKPALGGPRGWTKDVLKDISPLFGWAYVNPGTDTRDPLLSPMYADGQDLPRRVWLIGCELDLLAHEAWRMASRLAGKPVPGMDEKVGKEETTPQGELILEGDERFAWEQKTAGREYRWLLVPDVLHGFDMPLPEIRREIVEGEDASIKTEKLMGLIAEWLWR